MRKGPPPRSIAEIVREQGPTLLKIAGVVGVGETLHKGKPAILVLISVSTSEIRDKVPATIEGYAVRFEETGRLRPLD